MAKYGAWHLGLTTARVTTPRPGTHSPMATYAGYTAPGSSPVCTELPSGGTKRVELAAHDLLQYLDAATAR